MLGEREYAVLHTELDRIEQVIELAGVPVERNGRDLHDWLAQVLQGLVLDAGCAKTLRARVGQLTAQFENALMVIEIFQSTTRRVLGDCLPHLRKPLNEASHAAKLFTDGLTPDAQPPSSADPQQRFNELLIELSRLAQSTNPHAFTVLNVLYGALLMNQTQELGEVVKGWYVRKAFNQV